MFRLLLLLALVAPASACGAVGSGTAAICAALNADWTCG